MMNQNKTNLKNKSSLSLITRGFTLVELIVVITILAILGTIAFISLQGLGMDARDGQRISNIKIVQKGLFIHKARGDILPLPDDSITITASGTIISYQGNAGTGVLQSIKQAGEIVDPLLKVPYTYAITSDRRNIQILGYFELNQLTSYNPSNNFLGTSKVHADTTYSDLYPRLFGDTVGILTSVSENEPIQNQTFPSDTLAISNSSTDEYKVYFLDNDTFEGSGKLLYSLIKHRALEINAPTNCAPGFIPVPANPDLNQNGFCVAKYEMSYTDAIIPDSTGGGTDRNTINYDPLKSVVSEAGKYPVANLRQAEAISSCASMGNGYHLITNKEWLTIARNIELQKENWSNGVIGSGYIYNGNSNDLIHGCFDNTGGRLWATATGGPDTNGLSSSRSSCNEKRQLLLSNGQIIWDIAGNLWENVNKADTLDGSGFDTGINPDISINNDAWAEWTVSSLANSDTYGPLLSTWDVTNGIGQMYQADGTIFRRGGSSATGSPAGLFALSFKNTAVSQWGSVGFRCAK